MRSNRIGLLALASALLLPARAYADTLFHLTEWVIEQEIVPHTVQHVTKFDGHYYVSDDGVTVSGWGKAGPGMSIRFGMPTNYTGAAGQTIVMTFYRLYDGVDETSEYNSHLIRRHIVLTSANTCVDNANFVLKQDHKFFEVNRLDGGELMIENSRIFARTTCTIDPPVS